MTQTITELVNASNIAIEKHINKICYRDLLAYCKAKRDGISSAKLGKLFNDYKDKHVHFPINVDVLESYFIQHYNCYSDYPIADNRLEKDSDYYEIMEVRARWV